MSDQPEWLKNHVPDMSPPPHRWKPGQSGNPNGRPPKVATSRELAAKNISDEIGAVILVLIEKAKKGDVGAAALLLGRVIPPLRPRAERVQITLDTNATLTEQGDAVRAAVAKGEVDVETGKLLIDSIAAIGSLKQVDELEARIAAIEHRSGIVRTVARGGVLQLASSEAKLCD